MYGSFAMPKQRYLVVNINLRCMTILNLLNLQQTYAGYETYFR